MAFKWFWQKNKKEEEPEDELSKELINEEVSEKDVSEEEVSEKEIFGEGIVEDEIVGRKDPEEKDSGEEISKEEISNEVIIGEGNTGEGVSKEEVFEEDLLKEETFEEDSAEEEVHEEKVSEDTPPVKESLFKRLANGLSKTRASIAKSLDAIFTASSIDDDFYDEMEELLISSDIGISTTEEIIDTLKTKVKEEHVKEPGACRELLASIIKELMLRLTPDYSFTEKKSVVLVVGVNGVGKTTTIGKLAALMKAEDKSVIVAAADTFRAAAGQQLEVWVKRAGVDFIGCTEGQDPASVVFDAMQAGKARNTDIIFCDTAGRLHNKKNLMQELEKIKRVILRENPEALIETLIVLDGTTGQNALIQAREFSQAVEVTGAVITKLDGTAKGGIAIAVQNELSIPVKYIGVGEKIEDLQKFDANTFVKAIFEGNQD